MCEKEESFDYDIDENSKKMIKRRLHNRRRFCVVWLFTNDVELTRIRQQELI